MSEDRARPAATGMLGTLANGVQVVEVLADGPCTIREIAEMVRLPRQTTYRLVHTLCALGWVRREPDDDTYWLASRLWEIAMRSGDEPPLPEICAGAVHALATRFKETVHLSVYDRGEVVYVAKADGVPPLTSYTAVGARAPAYSVATGKVLLAHQPDRVQRAVLERPLVRHTALTLCDVRLLRRELKRIRSQGFAVNRGEWRAGIGGIAVVVPSTRGRAAAAIGFSGPADRLLRRRTVLLDALRTAVEQMHTVGGEASDEPSLAGST
ncbi:IclR family transcriptional regulator [Pseudonocardia sp.]|uniref:IclR family transcriptional regulator n=1 Tax=Pseudonocardia sp. TaxID=60912 RepID=UPI003D12B08B